MNDILPHGRHRNVVIRAESVAALAERTPLEGPVVCVPEYRRWGVRAGDALQELDGNDSGGCGDKGSLEEFTSIHGAKDALFTPG